MSKFDGEFVFDVQEAGTSVKASSANHSAVNETRLFLSVLVYEIAKMDYTHQNPMEKSFLTIGKSKKAVKAIYAESFSRKRSVFMYTCNCVR